MRKKAFRVFPGGIFLLMMFFICTINVTAFGGLNNNPGSHMELTGSAFSAAFHVSPGKAVLARRVPIFGLSYYRYEPCRAVNILSDASRDSDLFFFGPLYPHAQTPRYNYKTTLSAAELETIESNALTQYFHFMTDILARARRLYETGKPREGLYLLGLFMHGYEDLFAHKGITNEQHVWLGKKIQDPDTDPEGIRQCRESLPQLAANLPDLLGGKAGDEFRKQISSDAELAPLSMKEREKILNRKPDIYWEGVKYILISAKDSCARYIPRMSWDYKTVVKVLNDSRAMNELAGVSSPAAVKEFLLKQGYSFQVNYVHPDKFGGE